MKNLLNRMSIEEKIGQMCVPILQNGVIDKTTERYIKKYKVGMIRFCPNGEFDNSSVLVGKPALVYKPSEMARFTSKLQTAARENKHGIPLIIAVDQEGGTRNDINRCSALVYASHMCFGAADDTDLTYKIAKAMAEELAAMGINMVQAPIIDIFRYSGRRTIKAASFGEDKELVTRQAAAMLKGFKEGGIMVMIKHFPGYGALENDPHKGTPRISCGAEYLEHMDFYTLKQLINQGIDGIMAGHVICECYDVKYPATLSKKLINGCLREKLGFDGIVETDAMRMRAIQDNYTTGEATVLAAEAGNDLILLRGGENHFKEGFFALVGAVKSGRIAESVIDTAVGRILKIKDENRSCFKSDAERAGALVGSAEHKALCRTLAEKSVTVLKESNIPVSTDKRVLVISASPQKLEATLDDVQCVDMLLKAVKKTHPGADSLLISLSPNQSQIAKAVEMAKTADVIIYGTCNAILYDGQVKLDALLKSVGKTVVNVAMESPCDADVLENITDFVCMLGCAADWADTAVEFISGKTKVSGVLPITLKSCLKKRQLI